MTSSNQLIFRSLLSETTKERAEQTIIWISIVSFVIHLLIILLVKLDVIELRFESELLTNPISAIYTPFSFILLYEVYLLVYHIPWSISNYISKQYEIITLIIIRRSFKDMAGLELTEDWFFEKYDLQFTYDIVSTLLLFFLIYWFHRLNKRKVPDQKHKEVPEKLKSFVKRKKFIAAALVPTLIIMALYRFTSWAIESFHWLTSDSNELHSLQDVNNIFFDEFFTVLIMTDVLLLLFSLFNTDRFNLVIRNSGFMISTILIRISFGVEGLLNNVLIVAAVAFGVAIQYISNQYMKLEETSTKSI